MATIEWYDPEAGCFRKARFTGSEPKHVTQAIARAERYQVLVSQGAKHESAVAQLDAEADAEARHQQESDD
jgi:hypothetical protein